MRLQFGSIKCVQNQKTFQTLQCGKHSGGWKIILKYSKDGIHWSEGVAQSGPVGDRTTAFYNPFTQNGLLVYGRGVKQTDALEAIWK